MKIIKCAVVGAFVLAGFMTTVSAQYYGTGYTTYAQPTYYTSSNNSYTYTSGCITYYYNGNTRTTSILSNTCQNNYSNNYYNNGYTTGYTYTQPTYYTAATYYTYPTTYTSQYYPSNGSQYYTYGYSNGTWYPRYNNSILFSGSSNYYGYNTGYQYGSNTGCYYIGGYQVCY